ncbi:hypothetical protein [Deinococcus sp. 6GRE01]|uniref:hypothetical protein n=1 Tax=Deinococcus sp. 6GRE01 TaxID=2745873 RepID=UPI001E2DE5F0|nr:hypothetical protein [Deinococcus sp. 6GRE01]MCD0156303.1 hypothetical protein [Deinococcus sp. 6GRE01]
MKAYALLALALGTCAHAADMADIQPFGIKPGTSIDQLIKMGATPSSTPGYYRINKVPTPNSAFEFYTIKASPKQGVCRISGVGVTIKNDPPGSSTRNSFNSLKAALVSKYGSSEDFDFIDSNSIWKNSNDWMMSIKEEDRYLTSFWKPGDSKGLPEGYAIMLNASALNSTDGWVSLAYEFPNMKACTAEINLNKGDGL